MERHVKGACKPKSAANLEREREARLKAATGKAPQAKYVDPIVSATFASDGSFQEVCRALAARLRDSNSVVVFKALIIIHTLVRVGNQETVLGYLSGTKMLGLESVVSGHDTAQNLSKYASYLDRRIRTYGAIKYDIIRDKGERKGERDGIKGCNRLRTLSVDKGLLRETTLLQKQMDALADCKFYLDDMDDDITMSALRLLVKDLLLLFQAVNEGVINVLEHYFEMSHNDAATALKIYKRFCLQTESVVAYLGVAKKMQNVINVPIPNLKHAPVSLQKSLEEYLQDPNFEANRAEYKENKRIADGLPAAKPSTPENKPAVTQKAAPSQETAPSNKIKSFQDFFESIETEQASMFNPQTGSPTTAYFQQQAAYNPFVAQPTGFNSFAMPMQAQPTGFNAIYGNAFEQPQMQQMPQMQPQMTGFAPGGLLAPQPTGYNPFRQSMAFPPPNLQPQQTGMMAFSQSQPNLSAFSQSQPSPFKQSSTFNQPQNSQMQPPPLLQPQSTGNPFVNSQQPFRQMSASMPPPSTGLAPQAQPLTVQPTGSRNPFAPAPGTAQPKPAEPSMNALAFNAFQRSQSTPPVNPQTNGSAFNNAFGGNVANNSLSTNNNNNTQPLQSQATGGGGLFANVASSFASNSADSSTSKPAETSFASTFTPSISLSAPQRSATAPLIAQPTGFGGSSVKPFQPTSSFGASLAESFGGKPAQTTAAPPSSFTPTSSAFAPSTSAFTPTSSFGASLANSTPAFNPFRSSMLPTATGNNSTQPTGFPAQNDQSTGNNNFSSQFSTNFGNSFGNTFKPQESLI